MDAPPGDAVGDEVALRDLIVDLVGVARHSVGHAAHEVLEGGAVHGGLARHICHELGRKDAGALISCAVVVADGPSHERFVCVNCTHIKCHDPVFHPHAAAGAGTTPSCCN